MWTGSRPDQTELRFAELYAKALDKLADPRAPMRVGAVHALDVLGNEHARHRQGIVDVLCAFLRMPSDGDEQVRQYALRALTGRLRGADPATFWSGISLDLSGARLMLDLSGCRIDGSLTLAGAVLLGPARLRDMMVGGTADLRGVTYTGHAWFERSAFLGATRFDAASFQEDAWLGEATFAGPASFAGADFAGHAWFAGCRFRGPVDFGEAVFHRSAGFRGALAYAPVSLSGTTFLGPARVSRRDGGWNLVAPGWRVVVDPDNESVGSLLWVGHPELRADAYHTPA
jgi:hypothetical protein